VQPWAARRPPYVVGSVLQATMASRAAWGKDLILAQRCVAGDATAQRELFEREKRRVQSALFRILGTNAHMDDLLQETFLAVFHGLPNFRGEATLATWIDRCAVHVALGHLTRQRPRAVHVELVPDIPSGDATAEQRALVREAARRMYAELDRIEPKHRLAFTLHAIEERPIAEVARLMDASVMATKARIWRARRQLERRARLDPVLATFLADASQRRLPEVDR
jgi:RNA polymerase sigma-70 factor (ECF subfamily)